MSTINEKPGHQPVAADPPREPRQPDNRRDLAVAGPTVASESAALLAMIERAARDPSVDIDRMERLFGMHQAAESRRARTAYFASLSKLQSELPAAVRRGKAHNNKAYARFEDVVEALRPVLDKHGFSLTYRVTQQPGTVTVRGIMAHALGHAEDTEITLPHDNTGSKNPVQSLASSISYAKRYVTLTLTGIATDDDDDGHAAGGGTPGITDEQAETIKEALEEAGRNLPAFCGYFKIEKLADLPADKFDVAMKMIRGKPGVRRE